MGCPRLYDIENLSNDSMLSLWRADEKIGLSDYRYGFNGKELDNEGMGGGGSTYDYGFRIYNPQIAKFLSVDPLSPSYPSLTPYQFASNMPIVAIDLDGLESEIIISDYSKGKFRTYTLNPNAPFVRFRIHRIFRENVGKSNVTFGTGVIGYDRSAYWKHTMPEGIGKFINLSTSSAVNNSLLKSTGILIITKGEDESLRYDYIDTEVLPSSSSGNNIEKDIVSDIMDGIATFVKDHVLSNNQNGGVWSSAHSLAGMNGEGFDGQAKHTESDHVGWAFAGSLSKGGFNGNISEQFQTLRELQKHIMTTISSIIDEYNGIKQGEPAAEKQSIIEDSTPKPTFIQTTKMIYSSTGDWSNWNGGVDSIKFSNKQVDFNPGTENDTIVKESYGKK